jgi:very-short-patch-repair endonuclease
MTNAERLLWSKLRRKRLQSYQFYRQKIIGNYIVDFYCPKAKLVVEIDGGQHYDDEDIKKDTIRDNYMREQRLTVLRFSDRDVFDNLDGVIERINENLKSP